MNDKKKVRLTKELSEDVQKIVRHAKRRNLNISFNTVGNLAVGNGIEATKKQLLH